MGVRNVRSVRSTDYIVTKLHDVIGHMHVTTMESSITL
jgi:hypothetical protein